MAIPLCTGILQLPKILCDVITETFTQKGFMLLLRTQEGLFQSGSLSQRLCQYSIFSLNNNGSFFYLFLQTPTNYDGAKKQQ